MVLVRDTFQGFLQEFNFLFKEIKITKNNLVSLFDDIFDNKNSFIGFNELFNDLSKFDLNLTERGIKDSFPPYNVYIKDVDDERNKITVQHTFLEVAYARFRKEELSIKFDEDSSILTVEGNAKHKPDIEDVKYSYKGIATRLFQHQWKLSGKLKFVKASYEDGILKIEFEPRMEDKVTSLPIE